MFRAAMRKMKTVPKMKYVFGSLAHAPIAAIVALPLTAPYEVNIGPRTNCAIQYPPMPTQKDWLIAAAKLAMNPTAGWKVRDRNTYSLPVRGMIEESIP